MRYNRNVANPTLYGMPALLHQFHSRFNSDTVLCCVSPPAFRFLPQGRNVVFDTDNQLSDRTFLYGVLDRVEDIFLYPLADSLERFENTIQKTLRHIAADRRHDGRRRVNPKQVLESLHEGVNDMLFNPPEGVGEELCNALREPFDYIFAELFEPFQLLADPILELAEFVGNFAKPPGDEVYNAVPVQRYRRAESRRTRENQPYTERNTYSCEDQNQANSESRCSCDCKNLCNDTLEFIHQIVPVESYRRTERSRTSQHETDTKGDTYTCESEDCTDNDSRRSYDCQNLCNNALDLFRHRVPVKANRSRQTDSTSGNHGDTKPGRNPSESQNRTDTD